MSTALGKGIYSILTGDAAVAAIVGTKVGPEQAAAAWDLPYAVYTVPSQTDIQHIKGRALSARAIVQVDAYTSTYSLTDSLIQAIRSALAFFTGTPVTGISIQGITIESGPRDLSPVPFDGSEDMYRRKSMDFAVWHLL